MKYVITLLATALLCISLSIPSHAQASTTYEIRITTSNLRGAGTDANVFLTLYGTRGQVRTRSLNNSRYNDFEAGDDDLYYFTTSADIGQITRIKLEHDDIYGGSAWHPGTVSIKDPRGRRSTYPINQWLYAYEGESQPFVTVQRQDYKTWIRKHRARNTQTGSVRNTRNTVGKNKVSLVTFYEHCNYRGRSISIPSGRHGLETLRQLGVRNDNISSIQIPSGNYVTIYEHDGFEGRRLDFGEDVACLSKFGFNDQLSSAIVFGERNTVHAPTPLVTFYEHCNYQGRSASLPYGRHGLEALRRLGVRNDDISSIRIPRGSRVAVYENDRFEGRRIDFGKDVACLSKFGFNDQLSSVIVSGGGHKANRSSAPLVTFYEHCNYKGRSASLPYGRHVLENLQQLGIRNDEVSSIRIPAGSHVSVYENDRFGGRRFDFQRDVACLADFGFNDQLSSTIVFQTQ